MQPRKGDAKAGKAAKARWQLPESVQKGLEHVVVIGSVALLLSLIYLLFVILSGGLAAEVAGGTALDQVKRTVGLAKNAFLWSLWIVVLAAMIRHHRTESVGLLAMLLGAACWAIFPLIVKSRVESATPALELQQLGQSLITAFQKSGGAMFVLGLLRFAVARILFIASPTRAAARFLTYSADAAAERSLERPSLLRRCWELHFCRASLRSNCPRFLESVTCWKRKSGCHCDQGLATRLLTGVGATARAKVAEELEAAQRRARTQSRRQRKQKAACGECPIYLEHQKHKYRVVSWFAYPAAAAVIGFGVGAIQEGYQWVESSLGGILARVTILPQTGSGGSLDQALSAENAAVLLIGVLVVGLLLHAAEFAIFRLKL